MFSDVFLAMTPGEMSRFSPKKAAYMACHFSPGGKGLSNLPTALPPESLLLLDDSMPPEEHEPETVAKQLQELVDQFSVKAVLLDFQREPSPLTRTMAESLLKALPCPVAVTEVYAKDLRCPVFLSPPPVNMLPEVYLSPWLSQGVFLEIAPEALEIMVTKEKSAALPVVCKKELPLKDERLHCHYQVEVTPEKAIFTLSRTKEDLGALARQAQTLGVIGTVGLFQELYNIPP